jgi:hypothetical protein
MFSLGGFVTNVKREYFGARKKAAIKKSSTEYYLNGYEFQYTEEVEGRVVNCYSKSSGKLVGENVLNQFGTSPARIYLEDCTNGLYALVVMKNEIVFESVISRETQWGQLIGYINLADKTEKLKIVCFGGIVQQSLETGRYYFDSKHDNDTELNVFTLDAATEIINISDSILEGIALTKEPKSLTAISNRKSIKTKSNKNKNTKSYLFLGAMIIGLTYFYYPDEPEKVELTVEEINPFLEFSNILENSGTNVKMRMVHLYGDLKNVTTAPNYNLTKVLVDPDKTRFDYEPGFNSRLEYFDKWSKSAGYTMLTFDNNTSVANFVNQWPVLREAVMVPVQGVLNYIVDCSYNMLRNISVDKGKVESKGEWSMRKIKLKVSNWTPEDFDTLGSLMQGQPVSFESAQLTYGNELFSGDISLTIYGEGK